MDVADDYLMIKALNITHVLMVLPMMEPPFPNEIKYKQIQVGDSPMSMIGRYFDEAIDFIDDALANNGAILGIYCNFNIFFLWIILNCDIYEPWF